MPYMTHAKLFSLSFGFVLLIAATQAAHAQSAANPQCAPRDKVLAALGEKFGEARRAIGVAGQSNVMELFTNTETGTWTITATYPSGMMCMLASGSHYEAVTDPAPAKGTPT